MHPVMADNSQSENPSIQRIHGVPCRPGTTREMIEALPRRVAREKDIYVVSYPKSGKVIKTLHFLLCYFIINNYSTSARWI